MIIQSIIGLAVLLGNNTSYCPVFQLPAAKNTKNRWY